MRTTTYHDEGAPRSERYRALREMTGPERERAKARNPEVTSWWVTIESFPTEREARAFARGYCLASGGDTPAIIAACMDHTPAPAGALL